MAASLGSVSLAPPMSLPIERPEVLVVGGGVIGTTIALELARRGREVVLLEREAEVGGGASSGNAGYIVPSHATPLASPAAVRHGTAWLFDPNSPLRIRPRPALLPWLALFLRASTRRSAHRGTVLLRRLAIESLELHAALAAEGIPTTFERRGILNVYETASGFAAGRDEARQHEAAGLTVEVLDAGTAVTREPTLRGRLAGAVLYPDEASCDPALYTSAIGAAARAAGARIETGVEALALSCDRGRVTAVATTSGSFAGRTTVLAAGVWSDRLARPAGIRLRLEGGKGYHVDFERNDFQPTIPVFLQEARVTTTPLPGTFRLTGGLDLCGLDMRIDRRRVDALVTAARRLLAVEATASEQRVWRGLRPCSPDGLPLIGRARGVGDLIVCTGHAMLGLTLAPVSARIVADLIGGATPPEVRSLDPSRFVRR
jgi:D-amino-acid dehydrogenase